MEKKSDWQERLDADYARKSFLDRFHLSLNEISELGIGWMISCAVIVYLFYLDSIIREGRLSDELILFFFIFGLSFFTHELAHKFAAIRYGARAEYRLAKEALMMTLISIIIRFPILATGAVFWWGEASASSGIRGRVSLAGPISNLILAGFFMTIHGLGWIFSNTTPEIASWMIILGIMGVGLNVFLATFNLLPIGILDGAKVLNWDPRIWGAVFGSCILLLLTGGGLTFFL
ncbi:MAG: site-2 protease family protein [Candidatus Thorarchaeota archaeon]